MSSDWANFKKLLTAEPLPTALIDLDALEANAALLIAKMGDNDVTMRVASKSIRHVGLLKRIAEIGGEKFVGLMCFTAREAAFLVDQGFDDLLIAYPFSRPDEAEVVAELTAHGAKVWATIDSPEHVPILANAGRKHGTVVQACLDVDMTWRAMGQHFGVRRSPVRGADPALAVGKAIAETDGVALTAVLGYEAAVAGMADVTPGSRLLDPVRQLIKSRSRPVATNRRNEVVAALRDSGHAIEVVNGGGTGSVEFTAHDGSVTEVTAGSGFLCPHLFDNYSDLDLQPAAFFALSIVRSSDADHITCFGGGYPASGEAGASRLPKIWLPDGLVPVDMEGWGEVQTPFQWRGRGDRPGLGDPVIARHAKGGELAERFAEFLLFRGGEVVAREPSYRGMGQCFG